MGGVERRVDRRTQGRARWPALGLLLLLLAVTMILWRLRGSHGHEVEYFGRTTPPDEEVFRFANGAEPETLDPGLLSGQPDGRVARLLFEGLVTPDPETLVPRPGMAKSWELAPDGVTYLFHLRTDSRWTNGDRVTAHDFEWSWLRLLHPDTPARYADLFYLIRNARAYKKKEIADPAPVGIRALDDSTFQVVLEVPTPYFLQLLTYHPFLPVHRRTLETWGDRWTHPEHIVSNGPFRLLRHRQNDRLEFEKFPGYWDAARVRLRRIVCYSVDDPSTMLSMYRAGMTDWNPSGYVPAQMIPYIQHYADYRTGPYLALYFYSMVVTEPPLDDPRVRQALAYAIDRERIARYVLHGSGAPWGNIVPHGFRDYPYPEGVHFDPERARRLLADAGYPGGQGFPAVELLFNTGEDNKKIGEAVQAMWKEHLGIDLRLSSQEWASYMRATVECRYQIARRSWIGDYMDPNSFLAILVTGDGNSRTRWSNARFDSLVAAAGREREPVQRLQLLAQAEAVALDAMPFIPIYAYCNREFVAPYVRGIYPTALDEHPLKYVSLARGEDRMGRAHAGEEQALGRAAEDSVAVGGATTGTGSGR
jgi:oligopeptide transport system substrate-binding protein